MATEEGNVKVASEWPSICRRYELTNAQRRRKEKGKSIYERDRVVKPYVYSKGPNV